MPYVKQERRPDLDPVVNTLAVNGLEEGVITSFLIQLSNITNYGCQTTNRINRAVEEARRINVEPNGDINYILFKCCKYYIDPSYNNYKTFIGEICYVADALDKGVFKDEYREAAAEIRRRILGPYEDQKIEENGDV